MTFDVATLTEAGGREINEDSIGGYMEDLKFGVWVLADGLGGHGAGEVASRLAVEAVVSNFKSNPDLSFDNITRIVELTNARILAKQKESNRQSKMGSTLVCLLTDFSSVTWCHVGDSRLYHFRDKKLIDQTEDHSVSQLCVLSGDITKEQIRFHEDRNRLVRALGQKENVTASISRETNALSVDDAYLLCSDGFWEYIYENEMEDCLSAENSASLWLESMKKKIKDRKPSNCDNFSAICILLKR